MSSEKYPGHKELTSYLSQYENKSFWGFLLCCRDAIVTTASTTSRRQDLDTSWCNHFLAEAKELLNPNDFNNLKNQVALERKRNNIEDYWINVIEEVKVKEDILVREAEEARIQGELSRLRHKLSEIQEKAKMQNSSNREMGEDSVNEEKSNHIILRSNGRASSADAPASKSDDDTREIRPKGAVLNDHQPPVNITSIETENSNDAPEQTNLHCDDTLATNISDNTSNSDVRQELSSQYPASPIRTESKSLEDKEMDIFHDSVYKERVSREIIQNIKEKKLRDQNLSSDNSSKPSNSSRDIKTVPSGNDQVSNSSCETKTISSGNDQTEISELEQDDGTDKNQIVEQGLIEELGISTEKQGLTTLGSPFGPNSAIDNTSSTEINTSENKGSAQYLSYLFKTAIKSRQQEILNWAYTEETGLDPWIKSETSEFPQIEKDVEKKTLFVPW
ncbi:1863_t:CDS:2, partial [Diversispora eburnea]